MWLIIVALGLGGLVGYLNILPVRFLPYLSRGTSAAIVVLLFTMGAKIGTNGELLGALGILGYRAFILASGAVVGSVAVIWFLEHRWPRFQRDDKSESDSDRREGGARS